MDIKGLSKEDALTEFVSLANIYGTESVMRDLFEMDKQHYLAMHHSKIYFSQSDGRWRTYLPTADGKRKPITSTSRENLENKIVKFYKSSDNDPTPETFENLFPMFLKYKAKETSLANAHKLNWEWETYVKGSSISKKKYRSITVAEMKEWYLDTIAEHALTNRKFKDLKSLINMMFDFAIENNFTDANPSRQIKNISYKKFAIAKKKDVTEQVYFNDEEEKLISLAMEQFEKSGNTAYLGVCLNFALGLRVGEIVALKVSDINGDTIHIQRQEIKTYEVQDDEKIHRSGYEISDYVKTPTSNREIILTTPARKILYMITRANERIGYTGDWLLVDKNGERIKNNAINNVLRRLNRKIGTVQKGNHSIRKTCLSNLNESRLLTDEEIRDFAGHKDVSTTQKCYLFSTDSPEKKKAAYEAALSANMPNTLLAQ